MMSNSSFYSQLFTGLSKPYHLRNAQDLETVFTYLRNLEALGNMRDSEIRDLARIARLEHHDQCEFLFQKGQICDSWYILVSGAVLVDGTMFLPRSTFGTRSFGPYRHQNCQVLTASDFVVVDYQDDEYTTSFDRQPSFHVKQTWQGSAAGNYGYLPAQSSGHQWQTSQYGTQADRSYELAGSESLPSYDWNDRSQNWTGNNWYPTDGTVNGDYNEMSSNDQSWYAYSSQLSDFNHVNNTASHQYADPSLSGDSSMIPASNSRQGLANLPKGNRQSVTSATSGTNSLANPNTIVNLNSSARCSLTPSNHSGNDDGLSIASVNDQLLQSQSQHAAVNGSRSLGVYDSTRQHVIAIGDEESASGSGLTHSASDDDDDLPDDDDAMVSLSHDREADESGRRSAVPNAIRTILEKETGERSVEEIEVLLSFVQPLAAFARHPYDARRALCQRMVIAVVDKANTIVLQDGEELDAWSVLVSGSVELQTPEGRKVLSIGQAFGAAADLAPSAAANAAAQRFHGQMRTLTDDCQFLCVARADYQRTMSELLQNTVTETDEAGNVVLVKERRGAGDSATRGSCVIVRATVDRLLSHLIEEHSPADGSFVEDFLLTQRVFLDSPMRIFEKLFEWYREPILRDRVVRIVLLWLNAHFAEFERDAVLMDSLESFERQLAADSKEGELTLLRLACTSKARLRTVTLRRSATNEEFQFSVIGGRDWRSPVFVSKCERGSLAHQAGLRRGDQILEVNAVSFASFSHADAVRIFRSRSTELRMRVRSNLLGFASLLSNASRMKLPGQSASSGPRQVSVDPSIEQQQSSGNSLRPTFDLNAFIHSSSSAVHSRAVSATSADAEAAKPPSPSMVRRIAKLVRGGGDKSSNNASEADGESQSAASSDGLSRRTNSFRNEQDAPVDSSVALNSLAQLVASASSSSMNAAGGPLPEHVIRVYKNEQTFKYFLIRRDTTAYHVVEAAVAEFALGSGESGANAHSLCEVSVETGGVVRQKRLSDSTTNLADRLPLTARYFIKANDNTDPLILDTAALISETLKDMPNNLLQLTAFEVARCITVDDFEAFRAVQAHQYIIDLFAPDSKSRGKSQSTATVSQSTNNTKSASETNVSCEELSRFAELINTERYWTITEVLNAKTLPQRTRVLKHFIKMARFCKLFRNYNSMFAIISGLMHHSVSRLKETWDKLPSKYKRTYEQLERLLDPSRSHANYRTLLRTDGSSAPMIPIYPFCRKDLSFIEFGNPTFVDNLVNFDKMRLVGREVRQLVAMTNMPYDSSAFEQHAEVDASLLGRTGVISRGDGDELVAVAGPVATNDANCGGSNGGSASNTNAGQTQNDKDGTTLRRKRLAQRGAAKKMYDEALSFRRVRAYLASIQVVNEEVRLTELSQSIEAASKAPQNLSTTAVNSASKTSTTETSTAATTASVTTTTVSTAATTTTTTTNANGQPPNQSWTGKLSRKRFGADTVEAENKLLSLVEKTKPTNKDKLTPSNASKSAGFLAQFTASGRERSSSNSNVASKTGGSNAASTDSVDLSAHSRPAISSSSTTGALSNLLKSGRANHPPALSSESSSVSIPSNKSQAQTANAKGSRSDGQTSAVAFQSNHASYAKQANLAQNHSAASTGSGELMHLSSAVDNLDPNKPTLVHARKVSLSRVLPSNQMQPVELPSPVNGSRTLPFSALNQHFAAPSDNDSGRFSLSSASSSARLNSTEQQFANMQLHSSVNAHPTTNSNAQLHSMSNNLRQPQSAQSPSNGSTATAPGPPPPNWQRAYANSAAALPMQNAARRDNIPQAAIPRPMPNGQLPQGGYSSGPMPTSQASFNPTADQIRVQQYAQPTTIPAILSRSRPNAPPDYSVAVNARRNQLLAERVNMGGANVLASRQPQSDFVSATLSSGGAQYAPNVNLPQYATIASSVQYPVRKLSQSGSLSQCTGNDGDGDDEQVSAV